MKKFINKSLIVIIVFFVLIYSLGTNVWGYIGSSTILRYQGKFDETLLEHMIGQESNEHICVYVWRTSINNELISDELNRLGTSETIFGIEENFQQEYYDEESYEPHDIENLRISYKHNRLIAIKSITHKVNRDFLNSKNIAYDNIKYLSSYTTTIIVSATRDEILNIASDPSVLFVSMCENIVFTNSTNIAVDQIRAGYGTASNPGLKNTIAGGYDGSNTIIGIIEAEAGRYDPNAHQLLPIHQTGQLSYFQTPNVTPLIESHATHITSIIAGSQASYMGYIYEGIATGATIYQTGITNETEFLNAFNMMVDRNVDVINFSASGYTGVEYTNFDREVDNLIYVTKTLLVVASGNTSENVTSPGKAYNAITVGNAVTKKNWTMSLPTPFLIHHTSGYSVATYLSNKPEISAPGVNVGYITSDGTLGGSNEIGTSISAPFVTGVVSQLIQKYRSFVPIKNYITYFKAKLLLGGQSDHILDLDHRSGDSEFFFNNTGVGFVDAISSSISSYGFNKHLKVIVIPEHSYIYIPTPLVDYKIRPILIFEKVDNIPLFSNYMNNFNLYLIDANTNIVLSSSTSTTNTFEIVEYMIPAHSSVYIRVTKATTILTANYMSLSYFWQPIEVTL